MTLILRGELDSVFDQDQSINPDDLDDDQIVEHITESLARTQELSLKKASRRKSSMLTNGMPTPSKSTRNGRQIAKQSCSFSITANLTANPSYPSIKLPSKFGKC